ncbi:HdeD family acid-resistance protein [Bacteroides sp. 519]|uniref:HdeD family acid-resistance protein n=1 Tax=Bacteroides sp. 519 TaxID=2302937 RepID=UPI0013D29CBE|nr:DUF308 domain-containing protein [Bacteroides sp. 519]NDV58582.1 DUF308 domain-containing protein [Bacteroides sp. 519]
MKSINYPVIRSIFALIIGLVVVIWPGVAADYLVMTIGILFIIPGLIGIIGYFASKGKTAKSRFPIEAIGSFLFGLWLVINPGFFINILMYVLGFILLLGGIHQLYTLIMTRKWTNVPVAFFITPVLILIAALLILFSPRESQETIFIIIGATAIVYAGSELLNYFRFLNNKPQNPAITDIVDAEIIDE